MHEHANREERRDWIEPGHDGTRRHDELAGRITTYGGSILVLIPSRSSGRISLPVHRVCRAGQSSKR